MDVQAGRFIAEGKTKRVLTAEGMSGKVVVESKDDLTAGDGAKHDVVVGKAVLANRTTSNVFRFLNACTVPTAFVEQIDETRFLAEQCAMFPYEVVVRREAHGSFLKRHPEVSKGHLFPRLVLEFYLKTSGKKWKEMSIPKDDPLVRFDQGHASLYLPDQPIRAQVPFLVLDEFPLRDSPSTIELIGATARKVFLLLEKAWQIVGRRLVDLKMEFGEDREGRLLLADVIDNDSWRVLDGDGNYIDKQLYRDGADLATVTAKYRLVAELTERFTVPQQRLILWRASYDDNLSPLEAAFLHYCDYKHLCEGTIVTASLHKEPVRAYEKIMRLLQEIPDSVVIVCVGRSNGAGPMLSAQVSIPVITVPMLWQEFPEDVWSSLRTPSEVPVATILDPANAVLSALQILAMRNPRLYAALCGIREERLSNFVTF